MRIDSSTLMFTLRWLSEAKLGTCLNSKKDVAEFKSELHKMQTLEFDLTSLLLVEGEQGTGTSHRPRIDHDFTNLISVEVAHGTEVSQGPGFVTHTSDPSTEESQKCDEGTNKEETDEEGILEEGDDQRDNRGKRVAASIVALDEEEEDIQIAIAYSLADMVTKATTTITQPSLGEASSSQVQDPTLQLAELPPLVADTTIQ